MKKLPLAIISICLCMTLTLGTVLNVSSADTGPYNITDGCGITEVVEKSKDTLLGGVEYFNYTVKSHGAGDESQPVYSYDTYGAIGGEGTKMFVYSIGSTDGLDFSRATVADIVKKFEEENPNYQAVAAINGDFFDNETSITSTAGETECHMIQNGDVLKAFGSKSLGRGVVGVTASGDVVYYTYTTGGYKYAMHGYGEWDDGMSNHKTYSLQLFNSDKSAITHAFEAYKYLDRQEDCAILLTPDDSSLNTDGLYTVCKIRCDSYRFANTGLNGKASTQKSYFAEGEITFIGDVEGSIRPEEGYVYILLPKGSDIYTPLTIGSYVRVQKHLTGAFSQVVNAVGFKQQVLGGGTVFFKNNSNTLSGASGDLTSDTGYVTYSARRTAIGFKADGTPVILAIRTSTSPYGGATYYEIGAQLKALGCEEGFVLDGGGSSTFVVRDSSGGFNTVFFSEGASGRKVGNAVILAVCKNPEAEPDLTIPAFTKASTEEPITPTEPTTPTEPEQPSAPTTDPEKPTTGSGELENPDDDILNTPTGPVDSEPSLSFGGGEAAIVAVAGVSSVSLLAVILFIIKRLRR